MAYRKNRHPKRLKSQKYKGIAAPYLWGNSRCIGFLAFLTHYSHNKHNWIDFGSETLTQLGWHFVTLATEYELLGRSGQTAEQQRVLEEIFLGIQAIRRLDMQTQCMIKQMYDNRKANEKLVCESPFTSRCHRNWDSNVNDDCNFTPDFSGYNGFFIRCDAAQNLERFLHDSTEQSWNVDAVGGAFGGLNASATCKEIDPLCYMAATQHFMSQDQLINLFYGFTFIKKYIPQNATITTCNGETYRPLEMVQQLSESIVDKINVNGDHITLPGSADCCRKIVKLSECEGGNVRHTLYGLLKATEYITGKDKWVTWAQQLDFEVFPANAPNSGLSFYLKESCMFKDLSNIARDKRRKMVAIAKDKNKEILLLGNDLLFPSGESISDRVGGKDFFKSLLCDAPCSGPCHAGKGYNTWPGPNPGDGWPSDFQCANIPGWEGHRWDAEGVGVDEGVNGPPSRGNGLDYMALFVTIQPLAAGIARLRE